ncbi:MAG: FtsQ-type POTRA domain-containing protein, partial [Abitibacteriaceae bacterium]|nr:FtsQ-type POTRA domain-containing protein [Abditibacteriaceae bacterium]
MEPIRGPLDYHRYPPRNRHRTNSQNDTSSQHTMPNNTPNSQPTQPPATPRASTARTPAQGTPTSPAPGGSARFAMPGQTPSRAASSAPPPQRVLRRPGEQDVAEQHRQYQMANPQANSRPVQTPLYAVEDEDEQVVPRRRKSRRRVKNGATHQVPPQNDVIMRHRFSPHSLPADLADPNIATDEAAAHPPHRIRRKRQASLFFSRGRRKRLAPHQAFENALEPPPTTTARPARRPFWLWVRRGATLLLAVGCAELLFAALTSPRMAVREVRVSGLNVTSEAAVQPVAMSLVGQNWIRAHVREAARKVAVLPSIRSAQVVRVLSWPPRLELQVEERQPFARVGGGGDWWVVDEAGIPFRHATSAD